MNALKRWMTNEKAAFLSAAMLLIIVGAKTGYNALFTDYPLPGKPTMAIPEVRGADAAPDAEIQADQLAKYLKFGERNFTHPAEGYPVNFHTRLELSYYAKTKELAINTIKLTCTPSTGIPDAIRVHLPRGVSVVSVDAGPLYEKHTIKPDEHHLVCTVSLKRKTDKPIVIKMKATQPLPGLGKHVMIPTIHVEDTKTMDGFIGLRSRTAFPISVAAAKGVAKASKSELPILMRFAKYAYRIESPRYQIVIQLTEPGKRLAPRKRTPPRNDDKKPGKPGEKEPGDGGGFPYTYCGIVGTGGKRCIMFKDEDDKIHRLNVGGKIEGYTIKSISATSAVFVDKDGNEYPVYDAFYRFASPEQDQTEGRHEGIQPAPPTGPGTGMK